MSISENTNFWRTLKADHVFFSVRNGQVSSPDRSVDECYRNGLQLSFGGDYMSNHDTEVAETSQLKRCRYSLFAFYSEVSGHYSIIYARLNHFGYFLPTTENLGVWALMIGPSVFVNLLVTSWFKEGKSTILVGHPFAFVQRGTTTKKNHHDSKAPRSMKRTWRLVERRYLRL